MSPSINYSLNVNGLGGSITQAIQRIADGGLPLEIPLPAGKPGTLSTRTSGTAGVATVGTGHGITTSNTVDVYFAGGVAFGCTVSATTSTTITFSSASGDSLPVVTTAIVVTAQVPFNVSILGDDLTFIAINQKFANQNITDQSQVTLLDVSSATVVQLDLEANTPRVWDVAGGSDNPFTGNAIVSALASCGSSIQGATLQIYLLQEALG